MVESYELARSQVTVALNLLEGLGYTVNYEKSVLTPTTSIKFLGFAVDSVNLILSLSRDKIKKVRKECQQLLNNPSPTIQELCKLLGHLTSSIQAVFPAPLHFRHLQADKNRAFSINQNYAATVKLSSLAKEELLWWRDNLETWNGKALTTGDPDLIIETDASRKGWGAFCMGVSSGGQWSTQEQMLHIICLELLAGAFAFKIFARNKAQMRIRLLMDNVSAVYYINKMGRPSPLCLLS